jgi:hypothetical protein
LSESSEAERLDRLASIAGVSAEVNEAEPLARNDSSVALVAERFAEELERLLRDDETLSYALEIWENDE